MVLVDGGVYREQSDDSDSFRNRAKRIEKIVVVYTDGTKQTMFPNARDPFAENRDPFAENEAYGRPPF